MSLKLIPKPIAVSNLLDLITDKEEILFTNTENNFIVIEFPHPKTLDKKFIQLSGRITKNRLFNMILHGYKIMLLSDVCDIENILLERYQI